MGGVTDPAIHDPGQFRYLVHAINPHAQLNALIMSAYDARDGVVHDKAWGDQTISMYDQPERLAERVSLSMSLIDQDHTETWGDAGLIVEAPEHNVVLTSETDAGALNGNLDFLINQADRHGVVSGDTLLQRTSPSSYNEVVAIANRDGSQVTLRGFFFKATSSGEPHNVTLARRMQMHASRLGLPVVAVRQRNPYGTNGVELYDNRTAVIFNGRRYMLDGYEDRWRFRALDERGIAHFSAPHEIEAALDYAVKSGSITNTQAAAIRANYESVDAERQTPRVAFAEDGTVEEIAFHEGYGNDEHKVSLGKGGHGYRTNLARQAEESQESMLNPFRMVGDQYTSYTPISPIEAARMVERACESLSQDDAAKVRQWFAEVKHATEQAWRYYQDYRRTRFGGLEFITPASERLTYADIEPIDTAQPKNSGFRSILDAIMRDSDKDK